MTINLGGEMAETRKILQENKKHKCDICSNTFTRKESLKDHIKNVHNPTKDYKCETCEETFVQNKLLLNHIQNVHQPYFKCKEVVGSKSTLCVKSRLKKQGDFFKASRQFRNESTYF